jgi:hypothetical protein
MYIITLWFIYTQSLNFRRYAYHGASCKIFVANFFALFSNEVMNFDNVLVIYDSCMIVAYVHFNLLSTFVSALIVSSLEKTLCIFSNTTYLCWCCWNYIWCSMDHYTNLVLGDLWCLNNIVNNYKVKAWIRGLFGLSHLLLFWITYKCKI